MTKLFTMKSLAFAGTAAFALALAGAPQAQAEQVGGEVKYDTQTLEITNTNGTVTESDGELLQLDDGVLVYYAYGKDAEKAKKYSPIVAEADDGNKAVYDISKLFGKEGYIKVAADPLGQQIITEGKLEAAPSLKIKNSKGQLTYSNGSENIDLDTQVLKAEGSTYKLKYKIGAYGEWKESGSKSEDELSDYEKDLEKGKVLGTTVYVRIAKLTEGEQSSPWSKEAKLKIAAKAKAPKISVKTVNITKAFEWKMGEKVEYKITATVNGSSKETAWTPGAKEGKSLDDIISAAVAATQNVEAIEQKLGEEKIVQDSALASPIDVQVRTKADDSKGKPASNIAILSLVPSKESPLNSVIPVSVVEGKKGKTASAAAIEPTKEEGYVAQYSTDQKKWKAVGKQVTLQYEKLDSGKVYVRLVSTENEYRLLPSAVTTITIPQDGSANAEAEGKNKITATGFKINDGEWKEQECKDYTGEGAEWSNPS